MPLPLARARSGGHDASHPPARRGAAAVSHRARRRDGQALTSQHCRRLTRALIAARDARADADLVELCVELPVKAPKRQEKADGRVWGLSGVVPTLTRKHDFAGLP
jgi:hypothetical protein